MKCLWKSVVTLAMVAMAIASSGSANAASTNPLDKDSGQQVLVVNGIETSAVVQQVNDQQVLSNNTIQLTARQSEESSPQAIAKTAINGMQAATNSAMRRTSGFTFAVTAVGIQQGAVTGNASDNPNAIAPQTKQVGSVS